MRSLALLLVVAVLGCSSAEGEEESVQADDVCVEGTAAKEIVLVNSAESKDRSLSWVVQQSGTTLREAENGDGNGNTPRARCSTRPNAYDTFPTQWIGPRRAILIVDN